MDLEAISSSKSLTSLLLMFMQEKQPIFFFIGSLVQSLLHKQMQIFQKSQNPTSSFS